MKYTRDWSERGGKQEKREENDKRVKERLQYIV